MAVLTRKVEIAKWDDRFGLAEYEAPADAVTKDLRTKGNALSFWRCETSNEDELRQVVLAMAAGAERIDPMGIIWIDEARFSAEHLNFTYTVGQTPVAVLRNRHVDVTLLDANRLAKVAYLIAEAIALKQYWYWTQPEIVKIVVEAVKQGLVLQKDLNRPVRQAVIEALKGDK